MVIHYFENIPLLPYNIDVFKWVLSRSLIARALKDKRGWLNIKLMFLNKFQEGN